MRNKLAVRVLMNDIFSVILIDIDLGQIYDGEKLLYEETLTIKTVQNLKTLLSHFYECSIDSVSLKLDSKFINDDLNIEDIYSQENSQIEMEIIQPTNRPHNGVSDLIQIALKSDPNIKRIIQNNPHINSLLRDPSTLNEVFSALSNKQAYNEMMKSHDRQLSALENFPEGFQQLQKIYKDIGLLGSSENNVSNRKINSNQEKSNAKYEPKLTIKPLPNPWNNN